MFKKINNRKEALLFGFIFLLSWFPLAIILFSAIWAGFLDPFLELAFLGLFVITLYFVVLVLAVTIFNFWIFFKKITDGKFLKLAQILFIVFCGVSIFIVRPSALIKSVEFTFGSKDFYEKSKSRNSYADCEVFLLSKNVSKCANKVLYDTGDLLGCLQLSLRTSRQYYINKDWDKNGFNCYVSGDAKACEDYVASPLKDSKLYQVCANSNYKYYDARALSGPDLDQIIADHDLSYKAKKQAEEAKLASDKLKQEVLANLPPVTPKVDLIKIDLVDLVDFDIFFDKNKADLFGQKLACTESFVFRYPSTEKPVNLFLPCSNFSDFYYHRDKLYKYTENQDIAHNDATLSQWQSAWESDKVSRQEFYKNFSESPKRILELGSAGNIKKQSVRDFNLLKKNNQPDQSYYTLSIANYPTLIYPDTYNFWLVFVNSVNINTGLVPAVNYYVLFNDYDQQLSCDNYQQDLGQTLSVVSFDGQRIKLDGQGTLKCDNGNNIEYRLDFDNENNFLEIK